MSIQIFRKCDNWIIKYDAFSLAFFANIFLGLLFSSPSLFGLNLKWFRILAIFVNFFSFVTSVHYCDPNGALFSLLFIVANIFRLIQRSFQHRTKQIPKYLQDLYNELFKGYKMSRPDFVLLTEHSRLLGVGSDEYVFREGGFRANRSSLSILVSGHMTAWCDGLPLHAVEARQFLDSVEWKSYQFQKSLHNNNNVTTTYQFEANSSNPSDAFSETSIPNEDDEDLEEIQVGLQADIDSLYLQLNGPHLELIKIKRPDLFYLLDAIVSRDISKKMYTMNDAFEKGLAAQMSHKVRERRNPIMRSLSFDTLHTASHGLVVTENWLEFGERLRTLKCLHDKNDNLVEEVNLRVTTSPLSAYRNSDVAYMMQNSHPKLLAGCKKTGVVPSLILQANHLNPESCKFRNQDMVREVDWAKSLEHCGFCEFCRPLPEGEVATHQVKKV